MGAEDGAVVWDAAEGARMTRPGVDMAETNEPREMSGRVVTEWLEADMRVRRRGEGVTCSIRTNNKGRLVYCGVVDGE